MGKTMSTRSSVIIYIDNLVKMISINIKTTKGETMIQAIYIALCFAIMFLGLIIALHIHTWIGLSIMILFGIKFMLQLPNNEGV